ncbi:MAG: DNA polymerase III subunit epsilon [Chlamydiae bacterium]|nr:DNA polymerase III subunit epsilon [Chlamydiota bacterium]
MGLLKKDLFVCLDCETTGLDPENDKIIEIATVLFNSDGIVDSFETLVDPQCLISPESMAIHHITDDMVKDKPTIKEILPKVLAFIGKYPIVGHGISMDISFLAAEAKKSGIQTTLLSHPSIDTLRLARLYGESPTNSLEKLREHFNIEPEGAHRAMNDVLVNIEVFKFLTSNFKTTEQIHERLSKPILLKVMPLGKHKGRPFSDIPHEYLQWAVHKDFDQDLIFSLKTELKKRKKGPQFGQAGNPFAKL